MAKLIDPTRLVPKKIYNRTLTYVNKIRKARGRTVLSKLPPGEPGSMCNCPIARALTDVLPNVQVYGSHINFENKLVVNKIDPTTFKMVTDSTDSDIESVYAPEYIEEFVEIFDEKAIESDEE